ncbi:cdc42 effector protein 1 [Discoglossus pictus]
MSLGNLPVIKTLMSRTKRGHQVELTTEMISPPLGDFRHVMHVGRKGEVFGDTSFLIKYQEKRRQNRWNYITKKLRQSGWINSTQPSLRGRIGHPISPPPPISPIIKNAVSLPLLANRSWDDDREYEKDIDTEDVWNCISDSYSTCGNQSAISTLPRVSNSEDPSDDTSSQKEDCSSAGLGEADDFSICTAPLELSCSLWRSDSMKSFVMDFGPSLMSEILEETGALHNSSCQEDLLSSFNQLASPSSTMDDSKWEASLSRNETQRAKTKESNIEEQVTQELLTQETMAEEPMTQESATQRPMTQGSVTKEQINHMLMTQETLTEELMTTNTLYNEPMTSEPITLLPMAHGASRLMSWDSSPMTEDMDVDWKQNITPLDPAHDPRGVLWVSEEEPPLEM